MRTKVALLPTAVRLFQHPYGGPGEIAMQANGLVANVYLVIVLNKMFKLSIVLIVARFKKKRQERLGYKY